MIKYLIADEYGITDKPITLGNPTSNAILEWIHQVLGNLVRDFNVHQTYINENDPRKGIWAAAEFSIQSTTSRNIFYSPGQLIFGHDMIIPIKHRVDWGLIRQQK